MKDNSAIEPISNPAISHIILLVILTTTPVANVYAYVCEQEVVVCPAPHLSLKTRQLALRTRFRGWLPFVAASILRAKAAAGAELMTRDPR